MTSPTHTFYASLQTAYDHFNTHLFKNELPGCLITLRSASRVYRTGVSFFLAMG